MDKRQDTFHLLPSTAVWLTMSLLLILFVSACHPDLIPLPIEGLPTDFPLTTQEPPALPTATQSPTSQASTPTSQVPTPTAGVDCLLAGGQVDSGSFFSEELGEDLHYKAYLPPCYQENADTHYPVVYLLHGLSYTENQWVRLGAAEQMDQLIADGVIVPFIIIMPGEARFLPPQTSAFADALVKELIPRVDQQYRTLPDKTYRAIGGLSRGAAWAVHIGFEHQQLFGRVGAHSLPLFEIDGGRLNTWLAKEPSEALPNFFIDIGRSDPERLSAQNFADQLNTYQVPHTWYLFNGGHTEDYWSSHLELYLKWYANDW